MLMFLALIDEERQDDFIKIYTRYKSLATKTAGYYLSNRYDVEEIVQTAFSGFHNALTGWTPTTRAGSQISSSR